ncbi:MAG: SDR family NAD(P)-dependent oxidoreductase [bacterium]|nr:SDR family NAD(P)-dependent oxidoreductase [bacterium]
MQRRGNTVLITGGASGIGLALARALLANHNAVIICGRDEVKLQAAREALPGLVAMRADVADPSDRARLVERLRLEAPRLNVLVNNAGALHLCDLTSPAFLGDLDTEIGVNLVGPVALASALLPLLRANPDPTIVNVTTGFVYVPGAYNAPYSATKAALHVMTRSLRFQLRAKNVRVVEVVPPVVDTPMAAHYDGKKETPERVAAEIVAGLASRRDEIVIGMSRIARVLARVAPRFAFQMFNASAPAALADRS